MPSLIDLCEKYFGCRNLYDVLQVPTVATEKEIRKAYHKLSLLMHPDRVEENKKVEATENFKVLGKIYSILSNVDKKAEYDDSGDVAEDDDVWDVAEASFDAFFQFKKITDEDINNYEKSYKGSELEIADLKKAYINGKGAMDHILETVPFSHTNEEDRLRSVIQGLIDQKEVPEYEEFINEHPDKRKQRKHKAEAEARLYAKLNKQGNENGDLTILLKRKQQERGEIYDSFIDSLAAKYGSGKKMGAGSAKKKIKKK